MERWKRQEQSTKQLNLHPSYDSPSAYLSRRRHFSLVDGFSLPFVTSWNYLPFPAFKSAFISPRSGSKHTDSPGLACFLSTSSKRTDSPCSFSCPRERRMMRHALS